MTSITAENEYFQNLEKSRRSVRSIPIALFSLLFLGSGIGQLWRPIKIFILKEETFDVYGITGYLILESIIPLYFWITLSLLFIGAFNVLIFILVWKENPHGWKLGTIIWSILTLEDFWGLFWIQNRINVETPETAEFLFSQIYVNFFDSFITNAFIVALFLILAIFQRNTKQSIS